MQRTGSTPRRDTSAQPYVPPAAPMYCDRRSPQSFDSAAHQKYNRQVQQMLMRSPEYQRFADLKDQTSLFRLMWWMGVIIIAAVCYADLILWGTGSGAVGKKFFVGATLEALPAPYATALALFLIGYGAGFLLVAPWVGLNGDVEDINVGRVIGGHVLAAAVFSWQPIRVPGFLPPGLSYLELVQGFVPALAPLITGLALRWLLFGGKWRDRRVFTLPLLWLPVLHTAVTMSLWYLLAVAAAENSPLSPAFYLASVPKQVLGFPAVLAALPTSFNAVAAIQLLAPAWLAAELFCGLLMAMLLEMLVFSGPMLKLLLPQNAFLFALYVGAGVIALAKFWDPSPDTRPYWYYVVGAYTGMLMVRGVPTPDYE